MSVDYTKLFTIFGDIVQTANSYYSLISTLDTDQTATETLLDTQNVNRLVDGLEEIYSELKGDAVKWTNRFVSRASDLLTDFELVTGNFEFGGNPGVQEALARLYLDMVVHTQTIKPSVPNVTGITKTTVNTFAGTVAAFARLDGVSVPIAGGIAIPQYARLTSQLLPDSETIQLTCSQDSERNGQRGSEIFDITGIGQQSDPFSVDGEHIGVLGSITVADLATTAYGNNLSFDSWTGSPTDPPDGWTATADGDAGTDYLESSDPTVETLFNSGSSLIIQNTAPTVTITQALDDTVFVRGQGYFLAVWAKRGDLSGGTMAIDLSVLHTVSGTPTSLMTDACTPTIANTNADWHLFTGFFVMPLEIKVPMYLQVSATIVVGTDDPFILDQIVITPATYVAGVAIAVFGGPDKFLVGDKLAFTASNSNAGKFQTFLRKAFRVQLPTDASPTISDSLVA
jgi:hypothetical protein